VTVIKVFVGVVVVFVLFTVTAVVTAVAVVVVVTVILQLVLLAETVHRLDDAFFRPRSLKVFDLRSSL